LEISSHARLFNRFDKASFRLSQKLITSINEHFVEEAEKTFNQQHDRFPMESEVILDAIFEKQSELDI